MAEKTLEELVDALNPAQKTAWELIVNFMDKPDRDIKEQRKLLDLLRMEDAERQAFISDYRFREKQRADRPGSIPDEKDPEIHQITADTGVIKHKEMEDLLKAKYYSLFWEKAAEDSLEESASRIDNQEQQFSKIQPPIDGVSIIRSGDKVMLNIRKNVNATDIANLNEWMKENRNLLILDGRADINGISIAPKNGSVLLTDELAEELRKSVNNHLPYFEVKTGSMKVDPDTKGNPLKVLLDGTSQLHDWGKEPLDLSYEKGGRVINPLAEISGLTITHGTAAAKYNYEKKSLTPEVTVIGAGPGVRSIADIQYGEGAVRVTENGMAQSFVNLDPERRDESIRKVAAEDGPVVTYALNAAYGSAFMDLLSKEMVEGADGSKEEKAKFTEADWQQYRAGSTGKVSDWMIENMDALHYYAVNNGFSDDAAALDSMAKAFSQPVILSPDKLLREEVIRRVFGGDDSKVEAKKKELEDYIKKNGDRIYEESVRNAPPYRIGTLFRAAMEYEKEDVAKQNEAIRLANEALKDGEMPKPLVEEEQIINLERMEYMGKFPLLEDNLFTETVRRSAPDFSHLHDRVLGIEWGTFEDAVKGVAERGGSSIQNEVDRKIQEDIRVLDEAIARLEKIERPKAIKRADKFIEKNVDIETAVLENFALKVAADPGSYLKGKPTDVANIKLLKDSIAVGSVASNYYGNIEGFKDFITEAYGGPIPSDIESFKKIFPGAYDAVLDDEMKTDELEHIRDVKAQLESDDEKESRYASAAEDKIKDISQWIADGTFWQEYDNNTGGLKDLLDEAYGKGEFEKNNAPAESRVVAKFSNRENYIAAMNRDVDYRIKASARASEKNDALAKEAGRFRDSITKAEDRLKDAAEKYERLKYDMDIGRPVAAGDIAAAEREKNDWEQQVASLKKTEKFLSGTVKNYSRIEETERREFSRQFFDAYMTAGKLYDNAEEKTDRLGSVFINSGNMSIGDAGLAGRSFGQIVNNPLRYNELIKKHAKNITAGMAGLLDSYNQVTGTVACESFFISSEGKTGADLVSEFRTRLGGDAVMFEKIKTNLIAVETAEAELSAVWDAEFDKIVKKTDGKINSADTYRELEKNEAIKAAYEKVQTAYKGLCADTKTFKDSVNDTMKDMYYALDPKVREDFLNSLSPDGGMCILRDGEDKDSVVNTCLPLKLIQGFDLFDAIAGDEKHTFCFGQGESFGFGALYGTKGINTIVQWLDDAYVKEYEAIKNRNKDEKIEIRTYLDSIVDYCTDGERTTSEGMSFDSIAAKIDRKQAELGTDGVEALKTVVKAKVTDLEQITAWEKLNPEIDDYIALLSPDGVRLRNEWTKAKEKESEINNTGGTEIEKYEAHIVTEKAQAAYEDFKHRRKSEFGRWVYNNSDVKMEAADSVPNGEEEVYVNEKLKEPLKVTDNEGTMRTVTGDEKEQKGYKKSDIFAARLGFSKDAVVGAMKDFVSHYRHLSVPESLFRILLAGFLMTRGILRIPYKVGKTLYSQETAEKNAAKRIALGAWTEENFTTVYGPDMKRSFALKPEAVDRMTKQGISIRDGGRTVRIDLEKATGGRFDGIRDVDIKFLLNLRNKDDAAVLEKTLLEKERKARGWLLQQENIRFKKRELLEQRADAKKKRVEKVYAENNNYRRDEVRKTQEPVSDTGRGGRG